MGLEIRSSKFAVSTLLVILVFLSGCATGSLIPKKYNEKRAYYTAESVGKSRSEAFSKAKDRIMARLSEMIISHITSISSYTLGTNRDYYIKKIMNYSSVTLLSVKPVYKNYKMLIGNKVKCGLVIYFPDSRIEIEARKLLEKQHKLESDIENKFKEVEGELELGNFNRALGILSHIEDYIKNLIFDRNFYYSKLVDRVCNILESINFSTRISEDKTLKIRVSGNFSGSHQKCYNNSFLLKTIPNGEHYRKIVKTDEEGYINFDLSNLDSYKLSDTLYVFPTSVERFSDNLYKGVMGRLANKEMFKIYWNRWKKAKVKLGYAKINSIEWQRNRGVAFWKTFPAKILLYLEVKEESGMEVILDEIYIKVVGDMQRGRDPQFVYRGGFGYEQEIKGGKESHLYFLAPTEVINKVREYYLDNFANIIFEFRFYGTDEKGNRIESSLCKKVMSRRDFEEIKWDERKEKLRELFGR